MFFLITRKVLLHIKVSRGLFGGESFEPSTPMKTCNLSSMSSSRSFMMSLLTYTFVD